MYARLAGSLQHFTSLACVFLSVVVVPGLAVLPVFQFAPVLITDLF
jgi:hypothetical protein